MHIKACLFQKTRKHKNIFVNINIILLILIYNTNLILIFTLILLIFSLLANHLFLYFCLFMFYSYTSYRSQQKGFFGSFCQVDYSKLPEEKLTKVIIVKEHFQSLTFALFRSKYHNSLN